MIVETVHPQAGRDPGARLPDPFLGDADRIDRPAPLLGEHTREVLREYGYDETEIDALVAERRGRGPVDAGSGPCRLGGGPCPPRPRPRPAGPACRRSGLRIEAAFAALAAGCAESTSIAAGTPLRASGTPASFRPISTPASVAISVRSLLSPRWPMRNIRPLSLPRPVPSDRSKRCVDQLAQRVGIDALAA